MTIRRTFLAGLFIALPLIVTYWVVSFVVTQIHDSINPLIRNAVRLFGLGGWMANAWIEYAAPIISVALAIILIYLLGVVGGNVIGRQILRSLEHLLMRVPVVRSIYSATRQFIDTFSGTTSRAFSRVVLVEYPRKGMWTIGFVTGELVPPTLPPGYNSCVAVFLPTTPNPTSGWLAVVPHEDVIPIDITIDDAFKLIISGGVLKPGNNNAATPATLG
jgi:uncharacterized membrane protein